MHEELKQILETKRSMDQAQKRVKFLNEEIYRSNKLLEHLAQTVDKEYRDVEALEGTRLKGFLKKMREEREKQIEKEKQEYLDAVLRYNQAVKEIELLEFERNILIDKLIKKPQIEASFKKEIKKYESELVQTNSRLGQELRKIDEQILEVHLKNKEILEAFSQGKKCLQTFWLIEQYLKNDFRPEYAPNHGFVPPGWNPVEYFSQIGRLEKARQKLPSASKQLKLFIEQLGDVYPNPEMFLGIKIKDFERFSSYFFDSYIADWRFKDRINQLYKEISRIIKIIESTMDVLQNEVKKGEQSSEDLESKKEELIQQKLS